MELPGVFVESGISGLTDSFGNGFGVGDPGDWSAMALLAGSDLAGGGPTYLEPTLSGSADKVLGRHGGAFHAVVDILDKADTKIYRTSFMA